MWACISSAQQRRFWNSSHHTFRTSSNAMANFRADWGSVPPPPCLLLFKIGAIGEPKFPGVLATYGHPSIFFMVRPRDTVPQGAGGKLCTDLITLIPREHVVPLRAGPSVQAIRDLAITMPNIENLNLMCPVVSHMFLQPDPPSSIKLLPSLQDLSLSYHTLQNNDDWSTLVNYLTNQTSGSQTISLQLCGEHPPRSSGGGEGDRGFG